MLCFETLCFESKKKYNSDEAFCFFILCIKCKLVLAKNAECKTETAKTNVQPS